jgi:hypothetical protein
MSTNPAFVSVSDWREAHALLTFVPRQPLETAGQPLTGLRVFVRDHRDREIVPADRTLEAHYGRFVFSQSHKGVAEARRHALEVSYGQHSIEVSFGGHAGRAYPLGPEPPPGDIDGRSPAVVTWHDGAMFYFLASVEMTSEELLAIAGAMYG